MERSSVSAAQPHEQSLQRYVLLTVMLGTGTVSLNNSSFNPAIPHLMSYFQVGEVWASWVVVAFISNEYQFAFSWVPKPAFW